MPHTPRSPVERYRALAARGDWRTLCDDTLAFDNPRLAELVGVWNQVRGAKDLPMRSDFSARALVRHLKDIAFLECLPGPCYRYGFYGSGLARYSGDFTGKHLDEVIPQGFLPPWNAACEAALGHRAPLRFVAQYRALNLEHMKAESFCAPLGDANGAACGLLVSVVWGPL